MNGALIIDKPSGMSSFDVLRQLEKKLQTKKMGYLGTLDPLATGVLVVFVGKATQLIPYFSEAEKEYVVECELGKTSDTYDVTGQVQVTNPERNPTKTELQNVLVGFLGQQWQIQPAFSAIHVQGKRAYELARAGKSVDLGKRQVHFSKIELGSFEIPKFQMRVRCSSGTYIRSLVHEIGERLQCGAIMTSLRRTAAGPFTIDRAQELDHVSTADFLSIAEILEVIDWKGHSKGEKEFLLKKLEKPEQN